MILGSNNPIESLDGFSSKIASYSQHPEYTFPEAYFDVAIATLSEKVPKSEPNVRPICLPTRSVQDTGQYLISSLVGFKIWFTRLSIFNLGIKRKC